MAMNNYSHQPYQGRVHPPLGPRNQPWSVWKARCVTILNGLVVDFPFHQGYTYICSVACMDTPIAHDLQIVFSGLTLPAVPNTLEYHLPLSLINPNPDSVDPWQITTGINPATGTVGSSFVSTVTIPNYGIEQNGQPAVAMGWAKGICQSPVLYGYINGRSSHTPETWETVLLDLAVMTKAMERDGGVFVIGDATYQFFGAVVQV